MNALSPLGMVSELPSSNQTEVTPASVSVGNAPRESTGGESKADAIGNAARDADRGAIGQPEVCPEDAKDYFVEKDGVKFAGTHLLIDLWGASNLMDPGHIDHALREAADAAGATILHGHFHHFSPNGGVSGVLVLAESHISIHTWPERDFAAIDIFMCGACNPYDSIPALRAAFQPTSINLGEQRRGLIV